MGCCFGTLRRERPQDFPLSLDSSGISKGPYDVNHAALTSPHRALVFTPVDTRATTTKEKFPAVVFAHGLCGPARLYVDILVQLASHGYVVIANQEQETCESPSLWNPIGSGLRAMDSVRKASDGHTMVRHLEDEVEYLLSRDDVDGSRLALAGHSMGGGAAIDLAAKLEEAKPGLVKAVVAIAPWNGIPKVPVPSTVAGRVAAPVLIFCSKADQICPCSGEIGMESGVGGSWCVSTYVRVVASLAFGTSDLTWHGGVDAIFAAAEKSGKATRVKFEEGGHFALAGINEAQLKEMGQDMIRSSGLGAVLNSAFVNMGIGMGEGRGGQADENLGRTVRNLTTSFLNEKLSTTPSDEDGVRFIHLVHEAKADSFITVEGKLDE